MHIKSNTTIRIAVVPTIMLPFECDEVVEEFDKLSKKKKEILLSNIADEMNDVYQENNFSDNFDNICFENTMNT